jgi:hypothetical protein
VASAVVGRLGALLQNLNLTPKVGRPGNPKLPCDLCGADDVDILAARPNEERDDDGPAYVFVTVHTNGDECHHDTETVSEAAWRAYEARDDGS